MVSFNTGDSSGTVITNTWENQFFKIAGLIQEIENDPAQNPDGVNFITATIDLDEMIFSGGAEIYSFLDWSNGGVALTSSTPYTPTIVWAESVGGDGTSTTYIQALAERAITLMNWERQSVHNELGVLPKFTGLSLLPLDTQATAPVLYNATFSFSFELEIEAISTPDGLSYKAKEYLI